ncbi:hypothetical protein C8T65DRAFT_30612 [Cerioporus squamosus]|nr:hypothetical protein C8T65DRAFT_30612 [Cerioporus squamosus]
MPVPSRGLLLTYTDVGSKLRSSAYEKWHDTEHVWPLLNLPGPLFLSATRWTAADCIAPAHLALYDLASPSAVHDPAYQELTEPDAGRGYDTDKTSDGENNGRKAPIRRHSILPDKLELMERRVYEPVAEKSRWDSATEDGDGDGSDEDDDDSDGAPVRGEPGKYMTVVEVEMKKFAEAEFNRWFDEEHIPLLARVPGWVRSRRFVLKEVLGGFGAGVGRDGDERGDSDGASERVRKHVLVGGCSGRGREVKEERPPKYLALHEWTSIDVFQSREFRHATSTPWRKQVLKEDRVIEYRIRVFRVARSWGRFEA